MVFHTFLTKMLRKSNVLFVTNFLETICCVQANCRIIRLKSILNIRTKAFFKRKRDALKRAKLESNRTYYKENIYLLKLLLKLHLRSKNKEAPPISETLVKPCALKMIERVLGKQSSKTLEAISLK